MAAAASATRRNGHCAGSLHAWNALKLPTIRQPVSPSSTMRCGLATGSGSGWPSIAASRAPGGMTASQVSTGNAVGCAGGSERDGRPGIVAGGIRTVIGRACPSTSSPGTAARS